jgi:sulfoxide reductase heme-binding subunit YedZ
MNVKISPPKALVFVAASLPIVYLAVAAVFDNLGSNPAEALIRSTGDWALRFLCIALAVTPVRIVTARPALARFRRMLGLYCFFYGFVHALCYAGLDMGLNMADIARDIGKRPFILVGFFAFCILLLLAATSWNGAQRYLGGRRWQALHRGVYLVAPLAITHFLWMRAGKNNFAEVWWYAAVLGGLLGFRLRQFMAKRGSGP